MKNQFKIYFDNSDLLLNDLYERKIDIKCVLEELNITKDLSSIQIPEMKETDILDNFGKFIKRNMNYKIKGNIKPYIINNKYYYKKLIENYNNSNCRLSKKNIIELIYNLAFSQNGINYEPQIELKSNKTTIGCFLMNEVISFIKNRSIDNDKDISDFIKINHILFCIGDKFEKLCLRLFLIINVFISVKYDKFSNYNEFITNFYCLYYKFRKTENLDILKEEILSKIDFPNYSQFRFEETTLNEEFISMLLNKLENMIKCKSNFEIKINRNILNNLTLLKLFHIDKIKEMQIKSFFKFSNIQDNYMKYIQNKDSDFDVLVDELNYDEKKLHLFNVFFVIACGLIDKIERDSLQIFNEGNNVITLFKKYADSLLETINDILEKIRTQKDVPIIEENFGFAKIFKTFFVLFTDLNNEKYRRKKLRFDLLDSLGEENHEKKPLLKISINIEKGDKNSNFTRLSQNSGKHKDNEELYYDKLNSDSLEEGCRRYILSKINDIIDDNIQEISIVEIFKILFGLNFFIPYVDSKGSLVFIPVAKKLNYSNDNYEEYGYQEFDMMFKVSNNKDIPLNNKDSSKFLPFVKSTQIKVSKHNIQIENETEFVIKQNALVIIENKIKFPKTKEKFISYITIMIKKLVFVIKLLKNIKSPVIHSCQNFQLLLIYDEIIVHENEIMNYINKEEIKKIVNEQSLNETLEFTIEIVYISQIVHFYNTLNDLKERREMKNEITKLKSKVEELERILNDKKDI